MICRESDLDNGVGSPAGWQSCGVGGWWVGFGFGFGGGIRGIFSACTVLWLVIGRGALEIICA